MASHVKSTKWVKGKSPWFIESGHKRFEVLSFELPTSKSLAVRLPAAGSLDRVHHKHQYYWSFLIELPPPQRFEYWVIITIFKLGLIITQFTPGWTHLISKRAYTQRSGFTANHIRSPDAANHVEVKRSLYGMYLCCPSHHVRVSITIIQHQSSHLSAIVSLTPYAGTAQHWIFNVDEICRFAFDS